MTKRAHGEGAIETRDGVHRLRYRVDGARFSKTLPRGTSLADARKELRKLLRDGDTGDHVAPDRMTVGHWIDQWIAAGAPGRRKKKVGQRTLERYEELLRLHVKPTLGDRRMQQLRAPEIDELYSDLEEDLAPMTLHHVHVVFNACLSTAERKGILAANPMDRVEQVPSAGESDHGIALDEAELALFIAGYRPSASMYAPVLVDAATGMRRNELLAQRWTDFDPDKKSLKVERALEVTKKLGVRFKPPKTARGLRTIALDDATVAVLMRERARLQRIMAGIPDGVDVDLSLVKLPDDALIFPAVPEAGEDFDFAKPRNPRNFTKEFRRRAKLLGKQHDNALFNRMRFHDLRGTHATQLLDRGVPVHRVAERIGDDPAVLLRNYAKRTRKASDTMADTLTALASGIHGS